MKKLGKNMDRREFIRGLGTTATALGAGVIILQAGDLVQAATPTKKYGMVIDTNRCTGCHGCSIACKSENNVPEGVYRSWVKQIIKGEYPHVRSCLLPRLCNNCEDAPCLNYCPTGATYRTPEDGVVHVNREICVGCHTCSSQCPMNIDLAAVMDTSRLMAVEQGVAIANHHILDFHEEVLRSLERYGRAHKLSIMLRHKLTTKSWFKDLDLGLKMLAKRKLDLWPSRVKNIKEIHGLFQCYWREGP